MVSPVVDHVLHEGAISIVVAATLAVLLAQARDIDGFVSPIVVVVVREVVGIREEGAIEPEAGKEGKRCYWQGKGKVAAAGRTQARRIRNGGTTGVAAIIRRPEAGARSRSAAYVLCRAWT
jgi:hypothetical protein